MVTAGLIWSNLRRLITRQRTRTHTHTFTPLPSASLLPCQSRLITARIWPSRWANLPCYAAPLKSSVPPSPLRELQDTGGEREGNREGCRGRTPPQPPNTICQGAGGGSAAWCLFRDYAERDGSLVTSFPSFSLHAISGTTVLLGNYDEGFIISVYIY